MHVQGCSEKKALIYALTHQNLRGRFTNHEATEKSNWKRSGGLHIPGCGEMLLFAET